PDCGRLTGIDFTPERAARTRSRLAPGGLRGLLGKLRARRQVDVLAADFSATALPAGSQHLVWSNCALHWSRTPDLTLRHWAQWLAPEGLLMFSVFGPDTFREVRQAAREAGLGAMTLEFVDLHDYGDMLVAAGLATPVMDAEVLTLSYSSPDALVAELRQLGGNAHSRRAGALISRGRWQRFLDALAAQRDSSLGGIPLTVELVYGHAFKPQPRPVRGPAGVSTVPLDQLTASLKRKP
ncbi:MAG TPA: methyltransferase domain-containing protein, partial [Burkholderiaceae bacterium]|nr:methyltransferase domain-containing protein [Burkholderiaceae bacterium]